MSEIERPVEATDDVLEYLDELRESGITNMFGAGAYLTEEYKFDGDIASKILSYWIKTFSNRSKNETDSNNDCEISSLGL